MPSLNDEQIEILDNALKAYDVLLIESVGFFEDSDTDTESSVTSILWFTAISDQLQSDFSGTDHRSESSFFFKDDQRGDGGKIMVIYQFASRRLGITESIHAEGDEYDGRMHIGDIIEEVKRDYSLRELPIEMYTTLLSKVNGRIQRH
ncbi:MAG: hypothetical protein JWM07_26 [Candidatus Saccharibacteria bacterium]|nr:hypothetical protein [Candidatus Saccharibacteria bacterium]